MTGAGREVSGLFEALDAAGLTYEVRLSKRGASYAAFRLQTGSGSPLRSFTALAEGGALRLTLHELLGPEGVLDTPACLREQDQLPVARLYRNPEQAHSLALTAALPVAGARIEPMTITVLLSHLSSNADALAGRATGASRQAPALPGGSPDAPLDQVLLDLGLNPRQDQGAFVVDIPLPDLPVTGRLGLYHLGRGWLRVSCELPDAETLRISDTGWDLVDRLQLWAPVGRYVRVAGSRGDRLACEVAAPLLDRSPATTCRDAMRAAVRLIGTAWKHARPPG